MVRFVAAFLLAVALAAAAAVEGRVVHPIALPINSRSLAGSGGNVLAATCEMVHYRSLCQTLTKLPDVTTPKALLQASVRAAASKAKMTVNRLAAAISSSKGQGVAMASSLKSCKDSYESLIDSLDTTRSMLRAGDNHNNIMSQLSAAGTFATDCEDIFASRPELKSPIAGAQRHVGRLVANCLDLAATIKH